jgi:hypothetical protein
MTKRRASQHSIEQSRKAAELLRTEAFKGFGFKGGVMVMEHPYIGTITVDHLKNATVIAGLKACDETGKTKGWFDHNIVSI